KMKSWGIDAWSKEYTVYIPQPDTVAAWIFPGPRRSPVRLNLTEPGTGGGPQIPPFNGYTGDGDVTADVVYVNYGLIEDYKTLDSLGISVSGKIALARYGRSFRGIKAREAQKRGAVGLIVYSDPQDDGYFRGDVYPKGPMRNADGIQRGSMMNGNGDPTTPSWSSVEGARRPRQRQRHGVRARDRARVRGTRARWPETSADRGVRDVGRGRVGAHRLHRVGRRARGYAARACRGVHQRRRDLLGTELRRQ